jgi:hypothetical protein
MFLSIYGTFLQGQQLIAFLHSQHIGFEVKAQGRTNSSVTGVFIIVLIFLALRLETTIAETKSNY